MKSKKSKVILAIAAVLVIIAILAFLLTGNLRTYNKALHHEQSAEYHEALSVYETIPEYKDVKERILFCNYQIALNLETEGKYAEAQAAFEALGEYSDCADHILNCKYQQAVALETEGKYAEAQAAFEALGEYSDCADHILNCKYQQAVALEASGSAQDALAMFTELGEYLDSPSHADSINDVIVGFETEYARVSEAESVVRGNIDKGNELLEITANALDASAETTLREVIDIAPSRIVDISGMAPVSMSEIIEATTTLQAIDYSEIDASICAAIDGLTTSRQQYELVNSPTDEYILDRLSRVPDIAYMAAVTEDNDPNNQLGKQGGYTAQVYFSSPLVNSRYANMPNLDVIKEGTSCGGSIEVYETVADAERRNTYLGSFDGTAMSSGSHRVIGTVVVRTSSSLKASQQKALEAEIIEALTSLNPGPVIERDVKIDEQRSNEETLTTLNTGHFVVSVPSSWIHVRNDDNGYDYYYAKAEKSIVGGYLGIRQDDSLLKYSYLTGSGIDDALDSIAVGMMGDKEGITEHIVVNGLPAITVRYAASSTQYYNLIAVFHEGYLLTVGYLDDNYDSPETWEIAQRYFSTISLTNAAEKEIDVHLSEETAYEEYPKAFTSSLKQYAIPLPIICYTTPASENGYAGLPTYVDGTVTKVYSDGEAFNNSPQIIMLSTEYGPAFFQVMSPDYLLTYNNDPLLNTEDGRKQFYALYDQTMDYTLPEEGDSVRVYGVYMGYSSVMKAGALIFGLDDFLYNSNYGEYDPSTFTNKEENYEISDDETTEMVSVKEFGFAPVNGYYYYSVILHNNMSDMAVQFPEIRITARDNSGGLISADSQVMNVIYPGQDLVWAGLGGSVDEVPASIDVEFVEPADDWHVVKPNRLEHAEYLPLEVKSARIKQDRWFPSVIGEIYNPNSYDVDMAAITVVFRDDQGNLLAGDTGYINSLKAGKTTTFEINVNNEIITENFEVYGQLW